MSRENKGLVALIVVAFSIAGCRGTTYEATTPLISPSPVVPSVAMPQTPARPTEPSQALYAQAGGYEFKSRIDLQIDLDAVKPQDVKNELDVYTIAYLLVYQPYRDCRSVYKASTCYSQPNIVREATTLHERSLPPSSSSIPEIVVCGYEKDELLTISLISPLGEAMLRTTETVQPTCICDGAPVYCYELNEISKFDFLPGDSLGDYTVEIVGKNTRLAHTFKLVDVTEPAAYYSQRLEVYVVAGYEPFEEARVLVYKVSASQPGQFVGESKLTLDENGIGLLTGLKPETQQTTLSPAPAVIFVVRKNLDYVTVNNPNLGPLTRYGWILEPLDYGKIIELDPANAYAYYKRGKDYASRDANDQAIADLERALELSTDEYWRPQAKQQLEQLRERKSEGNWITRFFTAPPLWVCGGIGSVILILLVVWLYLRVQRKGR